MVEVAKNLAAIYPEFAKVNPDANYKDGRCRKVLEDLQLEDRLPCILSVLDDTPEGCRWGWIKHWERIHCYVGDLDCKNPEVGVAPQPTVRGSGKATSINSVLWLE